MFVEYADTIECDSKSFSLKIVKLSQYLNTQEHNAYLLQRILQSGSLVGLNVKEAMHSDQDTLASEHMHAALSKAIATEYWL